MHVGIAYPRWRGKQSRHSRRMRIRKFTYLVRGPWQSTKHNAVMRKKSPPKGRILTTCTTSAWRNVRKRKYISMSHKNTFSKGWRSSRKGDAYDMIYIYTYIYITVVFSATCCWNQCFFRTNVDWLSLEQTSVTRKFESKYNNIQTRKYIWKCYLQNEDHAILYRPECVNSCTYRWPNATGVRDVRDGDVRDV